MARHMLSIINSYFCFLCSYNGLNKGTNDGRNIAHYMNSIYSLCPDNSWKQLGCVLETNVESHVDPEPTNNCCYQKWYPHYTKKNPRNSSH